MIARLHTLLPVLAVAMGVTLAPPGRAATLCGVRDGPNCVPDVCSVLTPQTCLPDQDFPLSGDLQMTVSTQSAEAVPAPPDHDLNTLRDLFFTLRACWTPPPLAASRYGMEMTVRISFKRSGEIMSAPRLTYVLDGTSEDVRDIYRKAIAQSLSGCTPLHFTKGLAGAIAGRPINIRYVDDRGVDDRSKSGKQPD